MTQGQSRLDAKARVVSIAVLRAILDDASGMAHRYTLDRVESTRAVVVYSNPDEYGSDRPVEYRFVLLANPFDDADPWIVFDSFGCSSIRGWRDGGYRDSEEAWQAIEALTETLAVLAQGEPRGISNGA